MDPISIFGLSLAGIILVSSVGYYLVKQYQKERKRRQLLSIRNFTML